MENTKRNIFDAEGIRNFPYVFSLSSTGGIRVEIVSQISYGGFGKTYKGRFYNVTAGNLQNGVDTFTPVVVKEYFFHNICQRSESNEVIFSEKKEEGYAYLEKFRKESETLSRLNHYNIVKVIHRFDANQTSYYVMEYVNGLPLSELVKRNGCMTFEAAVHIIKVACDALKYVHSKNILHLDIKPSNILIEKETGRVVLIDFGLSRETYDGQAALTSSEVAKSAGYYPKELESLRDSRGNLISIDARADVYSLGATLYYMVTGANPPKVGVISDYGLSIPSYADMRLAFILKRVMQIEREDRIGSMDEFKRICDEALDLPDRGGHPEKPPMAPVDGDIFQANCEWRSLCLCGRTLKENLKDEITDNETVNVDPGQIEPDDNFKSAFEDDFYKDDTDKKDEDDNDDNAGPVIITPPIQDPVVNSQDDGDRKRVEVVRPWYKTPFFYAACLLAAFGLVYFLTTSVVPESVGKTGLGTAVSEKSDTVIEPVPVPVVTDVRSKEEVLTEELNDLFHQYAVGSVSKETILDKFAPDAFFIITLNGDNIGSPTDINHRVTQLFVANFHVVMDRDYKVASVWFKKGTDLIEGIEITKK